MEAPKGQDSWFCIHYSDFCYGDESSEGCDSFENALKIVQSKPKNSQIAYQWWIGHQRVFTKPAGRGATWTDQHTGNGKGPSPQGNLFVWGTSMGIKVNGRTLFCMKDVSISGGDAKSDHQIGTFEQALA